MNAKRVFTNEGPLALVFCLVLFCLPGCFSQKSSLFNKPVLTINGTEISTKEFADRLAIRLRDFDALYAKDDTQLERAKEQTVQTFVLEAIARDYAEKHALKIEPAEVDAKITEIRAKYPDDFAFRRVLAEQNLSLEAWRTDLEFSLLQKKIQAKILASLPEPTEAEMKAEYDANKTSFLQPARVRLRQIVLEKEDDAKRIMDELGNGGDLAKLAKKFSVAPEGDSGGDTGWIEKGTLEVFDQAFKMNVGTRSKILKSPYGFHIYDVLKKEPEGRLSFNEAKAKIRAQLMEKREQKAFSAWLEEQVRKTSVKRNDALLQAIKITTRGS